MKNARFWEYVNGGWVKITLRPHQSLEHHVGVGTDEGYRTTSTRWSHICGDTVFREFSSYEVDCDGPLGNWEDARCLIENLETVPVDYPEPLGIMRPEWEFVESGQRDHFAEMAGY